MPGSVESSGRHAHSSPPPSPRRNNATATTKSKGWSYYLCCWWMCDCCNNKSARREQHTSHMLPDDSQDYKIEVVADNDVSLLHEEPKRKYAFLITGLIFICVSIMLFLPPYLLTCLPWMKLPDFVATECTMLASGMEKCEGVKNLDCQVHPFQKQRYSCCRGFVKVSYVPVGEPSTHRVQALAYRTPSREYTDEQSAIDFVRSFGVPPAQKYVSLNATAEQVINGVTFDLASLNSTRVSENGTFVCMYDPTDFSNVVAEMDVSVPRNVAGYLAMWVIFSFCFFLPGCYLTVSFFMYIGKDKGDDTVKLVEMPQAKLSLSRLSHSNANGNGSMSLSRIDAHDSTQFHNNSYHPNQSNALSFSVDESGRRGSRGKPSISLRV
eukprot:GFYU01005736.1.p1 GENE.GFYU01005736.1~~GFYU01005736.1.p1  ORF type:complete len:381 (-),score=60.21 GFYU01005736.1:323-1465(-)